MLQSSVSLSACRATDTQNFAEGPDGPGGISLTTHADHFKARKCCMVETVSACISLAVFRYARLSAGSATQED